MINIRTPQQMIEECCDLEWLGVEQIISFTDSLTSHIRHVQEAGRRLGVPEHQLAVHDWSKWTRKQFPYYARQFFPGSSPVEADHIPDDFAGAWLNHIHSECHHWQHWIFPDGFTPKGSSVENGVLPMPENYVREMVADWMGDSKTYTGSWDMTDWLNDNLCKIRLHSQTWETLRVVLGELGYRLIVDVLANRYRVSDASMPVPRPKAISWG